MSMWGETLAERLLFISFVGSRLTGHSMELTQKNWTKQKDYFKFEKYVVDISPVMCVNTKFGKVPPTLLVHGQGDNQVPYSNALRLKAVLDYMSVPNKLILTTGNEDNHMLGGDFLPDIEQVIFKSQTWLSEAKDWIERYL
jgi:dipeptidyl aminopeptidase/acylaminoacyl peptidase